MKLDPGIHIAMHSVLSLKPGVTGRRQRSCDSWGRAGRTKGAPYASLASRPYCAGYAVLNVVRDDSVCFYSTHCSKIYSISVLDGWVADGLQYPVRADL
jgi:hypothetical protein